MVVSSVLPYLPSPLFLSTKDTITNLHVFQPKFLKFYDRLYIYENSAALFDKMFAPFRGRKESESELMQTAQVRARF